MAKVGDLIAKRRAGEDLSATERATLQKLHKDNRLRAIQIYFSDVKEKERFIALAQTQGMKNFSKWAVIQLEQVAKGGLFTKDFVEQLKKDRDQFERFYRVEKEKVGKLERERDDLTRRLQGLAEKMAIFIGKERA